MADQWNNNNALPLIRSGISAAMNNDTRLPDEAVPDLPLNQVSDSNRSSLVVFLNLQKATLGCLPTVP